MITLLISENEEKAKKILLDMLNKVGNYNIDIVKQGDTIKIMEKEDIKGMVSLQDKIIELGDSLYNEKKGVLFKSVLELIEKPLIEHVLARTEGNQLKAARVLGINRNTMRTKIKKLGINVERWKI